MQKIRIEFNRFFERNQKLDDFIFDHKQTLIKLAEKYEKDAHYLNSDCNITNGKIKQLDEKFKQV